MLPSARFPETATYLPCSHEASLGLEQGVSLDQVRAFSDIQAVYAEWSARGAEFLTPPKQHLTEIRCYLRDPDGHLIEVGQITLPGGWRQFLNP